jgi:hypothetical protein
MAGAQIPNAQLPAMERPIVGNPVVLQDVTNAIRFAAFCIFSSTLSYVYAFHISTPAFVWPCRNGENSPQQLFLIMTSVEQLFTNMQEVQDVFSSAVYYKSFKMAFRAIE